MTHPADYRILDLGCGNNKHPGAVGIDFKRNTSADIIHDLNQVPYPFEDNVFSEILLNHSLEHLDDIVKVMEELHRISKPGARILIKVPYFSSLDAFADPTHKHFFSARSFDYFTGDFGDYSYYSSVRFRKVSFEIRFWEWKKHKWLRIQNWLGFGLLANKLTKFYEIFFAFIVPAKEIRFELEVIKDPDSIIIKK